MVEQKWRLVGSFLGRTAEAIMITDAGARIVYVNQSFTQVTGYTLPHLHGKQVIGDRKQSLQGGDNQHNDRCIDHHLNVSTINALIDDALNQARQSQIH